MVAVDIDYLREWIGRSGESVDVITPGPVAALSAALDYDKSLAAVGQLLPSCWHWLYFHDHVAAGNIGEDGHPQRGDFLPPVPLPRRMWAGGKIAFLNPVKVGDTLRRVSTVEDVVAKTGRSGELVFVTVNHRYLCDDQLCIEERQDLVYREAGTVSASPAPVSPAASSVNRPAFDFTREITPDPVLLFRYSALTFNSHRIHYDRDYAMNVEGYPETVVQGPLTATLLLDLVSRCIPDSAVRSFEFRGRGPLYQGTPLTLALRQDAQSVQLCALDSSGHEGMTARARTSA